MNSHTRATLRVKAEAFFGAAFAFWIPDVIIHAIRRTDFSRVDVVVVSALLPIVTCTAAVPYLVWRYGREPPLSTALIGVLGIWVSGPFMMMLAATFSGRGFATL